ncbi:hypothetical protein [Xylella fastidiosa]|nr:hypothetical protein [Xylella fastidiosa]
MNPPTEMRGMLTTSIALAPAARPLAETAAPLADIASLACTEGLEKIIPNDPNEKKAPKRRE